MSRKRVFAALHGSTIIITFDYDPVLIEKMKKVPSAHFSRAHIKFGNHWRLPKELTTAILLTEQFGDELMLSPDMVKWGHERMAADRELRALHSRLDADDLINLKELLPDLEDKLRSYQKVGAKFIARAQHPLVADHPGTGKTWELIAGIFEAGVHKGPKLVVAPVTAIEDVWIEHLEKLQDQPAFMCMGGRRERQFVLEDVQLMIDMEEDFWLVVNPGMVQYRNTGELDQETGESILASTYPMLHEVDWSVVIVDECHKAALQNPSSYTAKALFNLHARKRIATSGTPIGGRPMKLWAILHWLNPQEFKSKARFADQWLTVTESEYYKPGGRGAKGKTVMVGDVRPELEEAFYEMLAPYMIRRTKEEVAPDLPPKLFEERWARMEGKQLAQYKAMAEDAEYEISETENISATSILAIYTRLKQFSDAYCILGDARPDGTKPVLPTEESCKLAVLEQIMDELGMLDKGEASDEQILIFSQFSSMADMIHGWLVKKGVAAAKLTGATKPKDRHEIVQDFQTGKGAKAMVMTTTAGGVAITLDMASTVVFMDETWVPDDQEQASDRAHRNTENSRRKQVRVITIRSKESIEELIQRKVGHKANVNKMILDLHRAGFKATMKVEEISVPQGEEDHGVDGEGGRGVDQGATA